MPTSMGRENRSSSRMGLPEVISVTKKHLSFPEKRRFGAVCPRRAELKTALHKTLF